MRDSSLNTQNASCGAGETPLVVPFFPLRLSRPKRIPRLPHSSLPSVSADLAFPQSKWLKGVAARELSEFAIRVLDLIGRHDDAVRQSEQEAKAKARQAAAYKRRIRRQYIKWLDSRMGACACPSLSELFALKKKMQTLFNKQAQDPRPDASLREEQEAVEAYHRLVNHLLDVGHLKTFQHIPRTVQRRTRSPIITIHCARCGQLIDRAAPIRRLRAD